MSPFTAVWCIRAAFDPHRPWQPRFQAIGRQAAVPGAGGGPAPDIDAVHRQGAEDRIHDRRQPRALKAAGPEAGPAPDGGRSLDGFIDIAVHRDPRMVGEQGPAR